MHHPLIITFRSLTSRGLENSPMALGLAADAGADLIELDVRLTLDRKPVVLHDALLGRTTTGHGPVCLMPSALIKRFTLRHGDDIGHVPMLVDVIERTTDGIQLAFHPKSRGAIGPVIRTICNAGTSGRTWLWLDCVDDVYRATRELPELRCTLLRPAAWTASRSAAYFRDAQVCGARAVIVPAVAVSPKLVHLAHQHHQAVFSRVDDIGALPDLVRKGLDGAITSDPAGVAEVLRGIGCRQDRGSS